MQRDFQNKTVVITGACRGIGAGIAERFARDGANLVMVSNAERVHETAETLRQRYQADILSLQVDVTDEAQVQSLYEQAAAHFGTIDVSIQNAGVITIDYYDRMPKADFEKVLAVNTTGVWLCCREAAKYMVLSLIHISEPTRLGMISYAVFCLKKKNEKKKKKEISYAVFSLKTQQADESIHTLA